uniref:Helicase C-terminal domain-containing protein n=1 Tax=Ananas comosus var. bracteatus TaxID=296719 RepID=A0A6V7PQY6_ANACO|nr:unnamed protein product [Ananas comosus var. bracteatus]
MPWLLEKLPYKVEHSIDLTQLVHVIPSDSEKMPWLLEKVPSLIDDGDVLVFALKKVTVDEIESQLVQKGFKVAALHGDKDQASRMDTLQKFKSGIYHVLVATDVAARGLDIKSIKSVVNYDIAKDMDMHIHCIGRTGRAGDKDGTAYTLITQKEARFAGELINSLIAAGQDVSVELMDLAMKDARLRSKRDQRKSSGGKKGGGRGKGGGGGGSGRGVRGVDYGLGIGYKPEESNATSQPAPGRSAAVNSLRTGMMQQFKSNFVAAASSSQSNNRTPSGSAPSARPVLRGFVSGEYSFSPAAVAIDLEFGESRVVDFRATRVAYRFIVEGVFVEARSETKGFYEEATTDNLGNFCLRGLLPDTTYLIRAVAKENLGAVAIERASPEYVAVNVTCFPNYPTPLQLASYLTTQKVGSEDIKCVDFIVFEQPEITILSGHVEGSDLDVLRPHLSVEIRSSNDPSKIQSVIPLPLSSCFEVRDLPKGKHLELTPAPVFCYPSVPQYAEDLYQAAVGMAPLDSNTVPGKKEPRKTVLRKRAYYLTGPLRESTAVAGPTRTRGRALAAGVDGGGRGQRERVVGRPLRESTAAGAASENAWSGARCGSRRRRARPARTRGRAPAAGVDGGGRGQRERVVGRPLRESTAAGAANENAWSGAASTLAPVGVVVADFWLGRYRIVLYSSFLSFLGYGGEMVENHIQKQFLERDREREGGQ